MRALQLTALAVLVFAIVGCGADEQARSGGAAEIVPAEAPVVVAVNSDLSTAQWRQADELLQKFPGRAQLLDGIRSSMKEDSGLDYEQDVEPALGDEIDLVWLDLAKDGSNVVGITKPKDADAFRRMIEKGNKTGSDKLLYDEVDGWFVVADEQAKLDRFEQEMDGAKLADDATYKDALAELPDEALVSVYAKGESITKALQDAVREYQGGGASPFQLTTGQLDFVTASLRAEGDGLRLAGTARAADEPTTEPKVYGSKLIDDVPGDAIAFLTFRGDSSFTRRAQSSPTYRRALRQFQKMYGLRLDKLLEIFRGEVALYVRPAIPFPQFTLLVSEATGAGARNMNQLFKALASTGGAKPCPPTTEDGIRVRCVDFGEIDLRLAVVDGKIVVTTGPNPVAELRSSEAKLPDSETYKDAVKAADMPGKTAGFLWIDLARAVPMILGFADAADEPVPPQVRANLEPLKSFLAWGDADGRTSSISAFLGID
ncbi:MAG TPA: DUF3352 domain-containing protein [Gaiellaceae bacterium]|jgi:Protein of unknown function (DUF3352)